MIWTAWNNGAHHSSGAGYGFKITAADRDRHFDSNWSTVIIELPTRGGQLAAEANVAKKSFWDSSCREIVSKTVGLWLRDEGYAPWVDGHPPKFEVALRGERHFRVSGRVG